MKKYNSGFTLIEIMLSMGLMASASMLLFESKAQEFEASRARTAGAHLLEYSNAVRDWLAKNPETAISATGTQWLKPTSCGGFSVIEYLRCDFPEASALSPIPYGRINLNTTVTVTGGADKKSLATITASPFLMLENGVEKAKADLSGLAALVVAAGNATEDSILASTTRIAVNSNPANGWIQIDVGQIPANEVWLRTDGKNKMHDSLVFEGVAAINRVMTGVDRVAAEPGKAVIFGDALGGVQTIIPTVGSGVIFDDQVETIGKLNSNQGIDARGQINITSENLAVQNGSIRGSQFIDYDDASYYANPAVSSRLRDLVVDGRIDVAGEFRVRSLKTVGAVCIELGSMGVDADDNLVSCIGGLWKKVSDPPKLVRKTFTSNNSWRVPEGVSSIKITMAGGGGSGIGWRSTSKVVAGHSGGYVYDHVATVVPGEVLTIEVGRAGLGSRPTQKPSNITEAPPLLYYDAPTDSDGVTGRNGTSSKVISPSKGLLLECAGGSGAFSEIDAYDGPLVPGPLPGIRSGSGAPIEVRGPVLAPGPYATSYSGTCGPGPVKYGQGNNGTTDYSMEIGAYLGGTSPFHYGSGGDVRVHTQYVSYTLRGFIIFPSDGRPGIVYIDYIQ